jgi:cyclin D1/2/4
MQERVLKCLKMIRDLSLVSDSVKDSTASVPTIPQSPIGVLDAACLSYKSDEATVGSCTNSSHNSPDAKRRKLNRTFEVELNKVMECGIFTWPPEQMCDFVT